MVMLLMETGMIGVFVALDLVLFYVFWEATLIPMYFIIGIWGGPRRIYATMKFVLYTMAGSLLMLVAIIAVAWLHGRAGGGPTFDLTVLMNAEIPPAIQSWLFLAFALAREKTLGGRGDPRPNLDRTHPHNICDRPPGRVPGAARPRSPGRFAS